MNARLAIGLLLLAGHSPAAPAVAPPANVWRSVSGQFVVHDRRAATAVILPGTKRTAGELELAPTFLLVSCERIKQAVISELTASRDWTGVINVTLRNQRPRDNVPTIGVERFGARWMYQVELPERLTPAEFVRTIVQVVLLELANRTPGDRSAEIPLWLTEGLTQQLLAARETELVLPPPAAGAGRISIERTLIVTRDPDPLAKAREVLRTRAAPTLAELSWPEPEKFSPADAVFFQASAQVFVRELLQLQNGSDRLRVFVLNLPRYYNWQTAFQNAFAEDFPNQLALEKWWALQAAHFAGRDHQQLWTPAESAQKLADLLLVTLAVRATATELPTRTEVSLQTVLREWDTIRQLETVQEKLLALEQALPRVNPNFAALVNDYQLALRDYLVQRSRTSATFGKQTVPPSAQRAVQETVARLDALDARRQKLGLANVATNAATTLSAPAEFPAPP